MISADRQRRDLAWCLHSPPLVAGDGDLWPGADWFAALDVGPAGDTLPEPKHAHHFRLGQHFEATLASWLDAAPDYTLVAANLQVQDGKRTVGEFDLLVGHGGRVEHWEAAVKFYLGTGDGGALADWYGPNTSDRFDVKLQRLVDHQLCLADDPHGKRTLAARHIAVDRSRCFMKGRLFHPWPRFAAGDFRVPVPVSPAHQKGWWLPHSELAPVFADSGARFVYLPKILWLSPLTAADLVAPLSFWELTEFIESPAAEQATHVALVTDEGEISRGFIVKDQWLERIT